MYRSRRASAVHCDCGSSRRTALAANAAPKTACAAAAQQVAAAKATGRPLFCNRRSLVHYVCRDHGVCGSCSSDRRAARAAGATPSTPVWPRNSKGGCGYNSAARATGTIVWSACAVIARLAATGAALRAARVAAFGICSSTRAARATSAALRRDQAFKLVVSAEAFVVQPARLAQLRAPFVSRPREFICNI